MREKRKVWVVPSKLKVVSREELEEITGKQIVLRGGRFVFLKKPQRWNFIAAEQRRLERNLEQSRKCRVRS